MAAILALAGLSTGLLWTVGTLTNVERSEEVQTIDPWSESGAFTYAPLLADGSGELPSGEPGYFTTEAPRVRVAFAWSLDDPTAERVTALASMRLVVSRDSAAGRSAWSHTEEIANATLAGGGRDSVVLTGEIDLPAIAARIEQTPGRKADGATWTLVSTVRFATAPNAAHEADASEFQLPLRYTAPLYSFPAVGPIEKDHAQRETIQREERASLASLAKEPLGPLLLLASLAALVPTIPSLSQDEDDDADEVPA